MQEMENLVHDELWRSNRGLSKTSTWVWIQKYRAGNNDWRVQWILRVVSFLSKSDGVSKFLSSSLDFGSDESGIFPWDFYTQSQKEK